MNTVVFKNANIIDSTGADPIENAFLVVEDDRIKEVLTGSPGSLPSRASVIDCQHQFLLPGLIDGHVFGMV